MTKNVFFFPYSVFIPVYYNHGGEKIWNPSKMLTTFLYVYPVKNIDTQTLCVFSLSSLTPCYNGHRETLQRRGQPVLILYIFDEHWSCAALTDVFIQIEYYTASCTSLHFLLVLGQYYHSDFSAWPRNPNACLLYSYTAYCNVCNHPVIEQLRVTIIVRNHSCTRHS